MRDLLQGSILNIR